MFIIKALTEEKPLVIQKYALSIFKLLVLNGGSSSSDASSKLACYFAIRARAC